MSERGNDESRGNAPVETLRDGPLKLSIFRNRGERGDFYSVSTARIFTDEKTGDIRETHSYSGSEVLRMGNLFNRGYGRIAEFREQDKQDETWRRGRRRSRDRER